MVLLVLHRSKLVALTTEQLSLTYMDGFLAPSLKDVHVPFLSDSEDIGNTEPSSGAIWRES